LPLGASKSLKNYTLGKCYDEWMQILDWLANHLTRTMLKRWMLIGITLVLIGLFSLSS